MPEIDKQNFLILKTISEEPLTCYGIHKKIGIPYQLIKYRLSLLEEDNLIIVKKTKKNNREISIYEITPKITFFPKINALSLIDDKQVVLISENKLKNIKMTTNSKYVSFKVEVS